MADYRMALAETAIRRLEAKVATLTSNVDAVASVDESVPFIKNPIWFSDFLTSNSAQNFPVTFTAINSGTMARIAQSSKNHPGVVSCGSSGSANSGAHQYFFSAQNICLLLGGEQTTWVFAPRVGSNTNTTIRVGFIDTTTSADCTDGAYFEIAPNAFAVVAKTASNSSRTTSGTLCTLAVNTWFKFVVTVRPDGKSVLFEVFSDNGYIIGSTVINSNIPSGSGREVGCGLIATESVGTSAHLVHLDYAELQFGTGVPLIR